MANSTGAGPGRLIVAVYAVLALAATGRSVLQITEYFERAPLAYVLSALAAVLRAYYYPGAGIYLAGKLMADVDAELVNKMRLGYPSGHWAIENDAHSLRIFHWVLKPGFAPQWYVPKETGVTASRTRLGADKTVGATI